MANMIKKRKDRISVLLLSRFLFRIERIIQRPSRGVRLYIDLFAKNHRLIVSVRVILRPGGKTFPVGIARGSPIVQEQTIFTQIRRRGSPASSARLHASRTKLFGLPCAIPTREGLGAGHRKLPTGGAA